MSRFAFLVHPLDLRMVTDRYPFLKPLPERLIEFILMFMRPKIVGRTELIVTELTGEKQEGIDGIFIGVPLTARMIKRMSVGFVNWRISQALELACLERAEVAGLGAHLACFGDNGVTINKRSPIPVTTGNSLTVAMAIQAAERLSEQMFGHIPPSGRELAVVGASGSIGQACVEILKDYFGKILLVVRDMEKGHETARRLGLSDGSYKVVTDPMYLGRAHVVISVTSDETAVIMPEHLSTGTIVIDVARPRDVSVRVAKERPDVLVVEGGVVAVPGSPDLGLDFDFGPGHAYACMCETMILAAEGLVNECDCQAYTLGKAVTTSQALEMGKLAFIHGFKLAGYRSFERELTEDDLTRFKLFAGNRKPCSQTKVHPID